MRGGASLLGRIHFGVGTGFTARRTMGLRAITLARLGEYVRVVQGLLKGETVEWSAEGRSHKIRFLNPELELINLHDPIPVHISAFGPRGRMLTAKLGAHWITAMRGPQSAIATLAETQKAWQEAGRRRPRPLRAEVPSERPSGHGGAQSGTSDTRQATRPGPVLPEIISAHSDGAVRKELAW